MPDPTNPAAVLATTVSQLYELAGNSQVPDDQRKALLLQAHDLRGDLMNLVSAQLTQNSPAYQNALASLSKVTDALKEAQADIEKAIGVVESAGQLAKSLDVLLKEAVKLGGAFV